MKKIILKIIAKLRIIWANYLEYNNLFVLSYYPNWENLWY